MKEWYEAFLRVKIHERRSTELNAISKFNSIYVLLNVHPNIILVSFYQLHSQILDFNTFITFLYMFRALLFSSSGGQIVLVLQLVSSLFR